MKYSLRSLMTLGLVGPPLLAADYFIVRVVQKENWPPDPFVIALVSTTGLMSHAAWAFYRRHDPGYLNLLLLEFLAFLFFCGVLFLP
jgi:hypothetical protein